MLIRISKTNINSDHSLGQIIVLLYSIILELITNNNKNLEEAALGRSKGGFSTKTHFDLILLKRFHLIIIPCSLGLKSSGNYWESFKNKAGVFQPF